MKYEVYKSMYEWFMLNDISLALNKTTKCTCFQKLPYKGNPIVEINNDTFGLLSADTPEICI